MLFSSHPDSKILESRYPKSLQELRSGRMGYQAEILSLLEEINSK
jgi:hypothetical protein